MAQHDMVIANQTFPLTRSDLNNAFAALVSQNSGPSAPSTTYANMVWYDTLNNLLKMRNEADDAWISVAYLDQTANAWRVIKGTQVVDPSDGSEIARLDVHDQSTWNAGTDTSPRLISPATLAAVVAELSPSPPAPETFTASGTWTKPAGLSADAIVMVSMWSGGGGGDGGGNGGGGGGGGYACAWFKASDLGASETVTVGGGGGVSLNGGSSSFGSHVVVSGGIRGSASPGDGLGTGGRPTTMPITSLNADRGGQGGALSGGDGADADMAGGGGGGDSGGSRGISFGGGNGGNDAAAGSIPGGGGGRGNVGARGEVHVVYL